jgi:hypothetical protein
MISEDGFLPKTHAGKKRNTHFYLSWKWHFLPKELLLTSRVSSNAIKHF